MTPMNVREITLTHGKAAIIDERDYERVAAYKWYALKGGRKANGRPDSWYAHRTARLDPREMHRFILNAPEGVEVDHKDGNGLNNTRANLRLTSRAQNAYNQRRQRNSTTGYKGVTQRSATKWKAYIHHNGRQIHIGVFNHPEIAARAYDDTASNLFGEFARLNFPKD